jgi:hypothetical protein
MTIEDTIENINEHENLLDALRALKDINSWCTSREVLQAWKKGISDYFVVTADTGTYRIEEGDVVFDLFDKKANPFFVERFREEVFYGIIDNKFYIPLSQEIKQHFLDAIKSGQSTTVRYSGLSFNSSKYSRDCEYVQNSDISTDEEKRLISAVYGVDNPEAGKVYLLKKKIVKKQLKDKKSDLIIVTCCLDDDKDFWAHSESEIEECAVIMGIRNKKCSVDPIDPLLKTYRAILKNIAHLPYSRTIALYQALAKKINVPEDTVCAYERGLRGFKRPSRDSP